MKFIILVIFVAIGFWLFKKTRQGSSQITKKSTVKKIDNKANPSPAVDTKEFKAVSIKIGEGACEAGKELEGKRFLLGNTPSIPLPQCDTAECHCKYVQHDDRRKEDEDRRSVYSTKTHFYQDSDELNHRKTGGRRATD